MANVSKLKNSRWKVNALNNLENVSYYHKRKLVEAGLLVEETVETGSRGRPAVNYNVSGKGRGLLALSKNWKNK